jgi:hypothetical protein
LCLCAPGMASSWFAVVGWALASESELEGVPCSSILGRVYVGLLSFSSFSVGRAWGARRFLCGEAFQETCSGHQAVWAVCFLLTQIWWFVSLEVLVSREEESQLKFGNKTPSRWEIIPVRLKDYVWSLQKSKYSPVRGPHSVLR